MVQIVSLSCSNDTGLKHTNKCLWSDRQTSKYRLSDFSSLNALRIWHSNPCPVLSSETQRESNHDSETLRFILVLFTGTKASGNVPDLTPGVLIFCHLFAGSESASSFNTVCVSALTVLQGDRQHGNINKLWYVFYSPVLLDDDRCVSCCSITFGGGDKRLRSSSNCMLAREEKSGVLVLSEEASDL